MRGSCFDQRADELKSRGRRGESLARSRWCLRGDVDCQGGVSCRCWAHALQGSLGAVARQEGRPLGRGQGRGVLAGSGSPRPCPPEGRARAVRLASGSAGGRWALAPAFAGARPVSVGAGCRAGRGEGLGGRGSSEAVALEAVGALGWARWPLGAAGGRAPWFPSPRGLSGAVVLRGALFLVPAVAGLGQEATARVSCQEVSLSYGVAFDCGRGITF